MTKELKERIYGFTATKSTKKETPKLDIDPMFEEEPGL
jgi:hypothetical protein